MIGYIMLGMSICLVVVPLSLLWVYGIEHYIFTDDDQEFP